MGKDKELRKQGSRQSDFEDAEAISSSTTMSLHYTNDLIDKFSGRDKTYSAARWVQEVEDNAAIFAWSPLQQLIIARRSLIGTAALWLRSEKPFKSWEELKTGLLKEFPDTIDQKGVHEMMSARRKKPGESCQDYLLVMKELGKRGKLPDYVAIKYIVEGIIDDEANKIMLYGITSYPELKEKLRIYETFKEKSRSTRLHTNNSKPMVSSKPIATMKRCYNCGEHDHIASQCQRGLKCFKCNKFGHIATNCRGADREERGADHEERRGKSQMMASKQVFTASAEQAATDETNEAIADVNIACDSDSSKKMTKYVDFLCNNNSISAKSLIDTGSDINLITSELYSRLGQPKCNNQFTVLTGLGGAKTTPLGSCKLSFKIDGETFNNVLFNIVKSKEIPYDCIIGNAFLSQVCVFIRDGCARIIRNDDWLRQIECFVINDDFTGFIGDYRYKKQVTDLVQGYKHKIPLKEAPIQLKIILQDERPIAQRPRHISLCEQGIVEEQVNEWLKDGIIRFGGGLKLKPKFLGPYQVTKVKRNDRYDVEKLNPNDEGPGRTSSAADHMKSWPEGQVKLEFSRNSIVQQESELRELKNELSSVQQTLENIENMLNRAKSQAKEKLIEAKRSSANKLPQDPDFPYKNEFEELPADVNSLQEHCYELQTRIDCMEEGDEGVIKEYEEREKQINKLKAEVSNSSDANKRLEKKMEALRKKWLPPLENLLRNINKSFGSMFAKLGCAGEIKLDKGGSDDDYDKYGISILVSFRESEQLQQLTRHAQSGGERALSTALYLMALQSLTTVPFRCVDEINQGMDPINERKMFQLLVKVTTECDNAQYFLLTPKLLTNLEYNDKIMVHTIMNGRHILNYRKWKLSKFIENAEQYRIDHE